MDFSKYGDASPEWNEYIQSHTILPTGLSAGQSVTDLRDTTNRGREAVAAAFMKSSGACVCASPLHSIACSIVCRPLYLSGHERAVLQHWRH